MQSHRSRFITGFVCAVLAGMAAASASSLESPGATAWQERGWKVEKLNAEQAMACDPGGQRCVCLEPLPCGGSEPCASFEENVAVFRSALQSKKGDRTIACNRAETGRCGDFRYFHFDGDIHRFETRWFNSLGKLVGQHNRSDYPEYCGKRTEQRWMGSVPDCAAMDQIELLCGRPGATAPVSPNAWLSGKTAPKPIRHDRPPVP